MTDVASIGGRFAFPVEVLAELPVRGGGLDLGLSANAQGVQSGRAALRMAFTSLGLQGKRVAVPEFCCMDVMARVMADIGATTTFYPVAANLTIDAEMLMDDVCPAVDGLLFVDYFGLVDHCETARAVRERFPDLVIVRDSAQALFSSRSAAGDFKDADAQIFSLRKFLPVPDGGFCDARADLTPAIGESRETADDLSDLCNDIKAQMMRVVLEDENASDETRRTAETAYFTYQAHADRARRTEPRPISAVSESIIHWTDFRDVQSRRNANAQFVLKALEGSKKFRPVCEKIGTHDAPLALPILVQNGDRDEIRQRLIEQRIFCPIHWPSSPPHASTAQRDREQSMLSLIVDQRYCPSALSRMTDALHRIEEATP
jgi:hypothetical protein